MPECYANIIVNIAHENVDRPFQYKIPPLLNGLLFPGMSVVIPFGKNNRKITGVIIELTNQTECPLDKLKEIIEIAEDSVSVTADAIRLAAWMKRNYGGTMIAALKTVLPAKQAFKPKEKKTVRRLVDTVRTEEELAIAHKKKQTAKERILTELLTNEILPYELVTGKLHVAASTLKSLEKQGLIAIDVVHYYRNPVKITAGHEHRKTLSYEQQNIVNTINHDYLNGLSRTYLIRGITGSGKTEVYMGLIENVLSLGRQCIVLIPEIALTYQTLLRFYQRFGDRVSVLNSSLSAGEKYDQCERAKRGEIDIIIGPRSALFVPFPDLGLIIIDEEHESSYKSEQTPRYHARETAAYLAEIKNASLVLGSATPSLSAYYRAKKGEYRLFTLENRLSGAALPHVEIVDLREELKNGNRQIFSIKLQNLITERLNSGEQIMLFLNRRGYSSFISCRSCGFVLKCPHCDVSLSTHRGGKMLCHYCGYWIKELKLCPACSSKYFLGFKAGTQQIEELILKLWPKAKVLRMDGDTTKTKDSYSEILAAFANGKADILVGTQMIVKGHDFPNVTLVGIIAADLSLNVNDYRAGERTFQLLTQAAGRAGRGEKPGEVIIQTYRPEHYSIIHAKNQNYPAFYEEEIIYRELASYPPAAHMLAVLINAEDERKGLKLGEELASSDFNQHGLTESVNEKAENLIKPQIIGPVPAQVAKINDIYRFLIFVKHNNYDILVKVKDIIEEELAEKRKRNETAGINIQFDFDPLQ
ncbi:MAG: primosomal protein N' [Lachnospiraceae bacterium]|nr:primosomal protein N' [Lachnospiraceae bacterium]